RLEVTHANDHLPGKESGTHQCKRFRQPVYKKCALICIMSRQRIDLTAFGSLVQFVIAHERHWMNLYSICNDEFHSKQSDTTTRVSGIVQCLHRISQDKHWFGLRFSHAVDGHFRLIPFEFSIIDCTDITTGA